jgi:hypothetical protein
VFVLAVLLCDGFGVLLGVFLGGFADLRFVVDRASIRLYLITFITMYFPLTWRKNYLICRPRGEGS